MATVTKDLGIATAYGYAKSKGYTGTEDEFAQAMLDITTAVDDAQQYAQDAEDAKDDAQASAESIEQSAQQIATNTSDIADLKEDLSQKAPAIYNASDEAEVVTFADGADDMSLKTLRLNLIPHQSGSGDPSPSNIRPISGYDAVTVKRSGKNLIPFPYQSGDSLTNNGITWTANADGSVTANGTATGTSLFWLYGTSTSPLMPTLEEGEEVFYTINGGASHNGINGQMVFYGGTAVTLSSSVNRQTIPSMATHTGMVVILRIGSGTTVNNVTVYPMIRKAIYNDATYEPFTGFDSYPITFPSSAGTVYGGTLDVVSGKLTVTYGIVDLGTLNWNYATSGAGAKLFITGALNYIKKPTNGNETPNIFADKYTAIPWNRLNTGSSAPTGINIYPIDGSIRIVDSSYTDATAFKNAMSGVMLVYELKTPTEIALAPVTIKTLLGTNTIWMSADGTLQADYPADTKMYIDALTAPDDDMIADSNIASGNYFTVNNKLYLSTTAIAQGEQIVVGTNCTQTDLATALNAINA